MGNLNKTTKKSLSESIWDSISMLPPIDQRIVLSKVYNKHMELVLKSSRRDLMHCKNQIVLLVNTHPQYLYGLFGHNLLVLRIHADDTDTLSSIADGLGASDTLVTNLAEMIVHKLRSGHVVLANYFSNNIGRELVRHIGSNRKFKKHCLFCTTMNEEAVGSVNVLREFDTFIIT